jgi:hypothetical protein
MKIKGGNKLQKALDDIAKKLQNGATLRVGFLENASYPTGEPVGMIAAIQDYGSASRGIPPRPFFRNMVKAKKAGWPHAIATNLKFLNYDVKAALINVGEGIKQQLQQSIKDTNAPPLAASTIRKKGFDKPLIDTSYMINKVDFDVK